MPLYNYNKGIDFIDSMYSPGNFVFFKQMEGTWVVATFLANAVGYVLTSLPGGNTYIGIRIYTSLIVSAIALISYYTLKKRIPWIIVAIGEIIAICLCWCPTTILYNYLTYLFMTVGLVLLYKGLTEEKIAYLILAGLALGLNLFVRFPNIVEAGFILAVWVYGILKKKGFIKILLDTLWCMVGYFAGLAICMFIIIRLYGANAYINMITSLFGMTGDNTSYQPIQMLFAVLRELRIGLQWPLIIGIPAIVLGLTSKFLKRKGKEGIRLLSIIVTIVTIVICYFRGMFNFAYNTYQAIIGPSVTFVIIGIVVSLIKIFSPKTKPETKLVYGLILLCMAITPLGSNNALFPVYNNLFLIAPIILFAIYEWTKEIKHKEYYFSGIVAATGAIIILLVQSAGFKATFVFRGHVRGADTNKTITECGPLNGCYTNYWLVNDVEELYRYWQENKTEKVLLLGNVPGVSYFLNAPTAIPTSWPDLGSYSYDTYKLAMKELEGRIEEKGEKLPTIILGFGAYSVIIEDEGWQQFYVDSIMEDGEGYIDVMLKDPKYSDMRDFIKKYGYEMQLRNEKFVVYTASDNK